MRVTFVLPEPQLGGGIKALLGHAAALNRRGHEVTVLAHGEEPDWWRDVSSSGASFGWHDLRSGEARDLPPQDVVIATFFTTIETALALDRGPVVHYCQGFEGDLVHLASRREEIDASYARVGLGLVVSTHLSQRLAEKFGRSSVVVPPPLDPWFRPRFAPWRRAARRRPWIAVPGIWQAEVKGVETALEAVLELRRRGFQPRLLRQSVLPPTSQETARLAADRFLTHQAPWEVARALRGCDLAIVASRPGEGFGLPVLEAMASGVPCVASKLPAIEEFTRGAVALVPWDDPAAFATAAAGLLSQGAMWRARRRDGLRLAPEFLPDVLAARLERALEDLLQRARERP